MHLTKVDMYLILKQQTLCLKLRGYKIISVQKMVLQPNIVLERDL